MYDISPVLSKDSISEKQIKSQRETKKVDSILSEYFLTRKLRQEIKNDPENMDLNYLFRIGEWTESMYLISKYVRKEKNMSIASRIFEQKRIVDSIVFILTEQADDPNIDQITKSFIELQSIYATIKIKYKYAKPTVDKKTHTTTLNSTVLVLNSRKYFISIEKQLNKMRQLIND